MLKAKRIAALLAAIMLTLSLTACDEAADIILDAANDYLVGEDIESPAPGQLPADYNPEKTPTTVSPLPSEIDTVFSLDDIPAFSTEPYVVINGNEPYFTDDDLTTEVFETYSDLDDLGRCGVAYANICQELMPTEERGEIGSVKPSGWAQNKYDWVDGKYLYNRCHLIGFQLAGENANELNLITGTRYMNVDGMLPFENMVADYVHETDGHVLYRVTPVYEDDNLLASGVLMEALSVEDKGESIEFCIFCYNAQPGVEIDYTTGENWAEEMPAA